ncbi:MarR family winged helix-turn-helix transcriptional regulator [Streptomyces silvisoli]|uniref:MarR family transcriptional regulator n=1 Tax=Streptomyces silvisoli TaxID=3034235 RepID=A0ABT5ZMX5_9ACTN|nr:MarR family transcriptional regulator [Streptomyces silvisoli]MDF3290348.1 MarR family transcriptional regulator [Streptomyces silvisoli]
MTASAPSGTGRSRRVPDLGVTDGLVQLSFLVQGVLARAADAHGLSVQQARLLGILRDREPGMAQLAVVLDLDKSSATGLVSRAERRGLVERAAVPEDRRAVSVVLTAEGRRLAQEIAAEVERQLHQAVSGLTETNRKRLSQLASQVVHHHADRHGLDLSTGVTASAAARARRN